MYKLKSIVRRGSALVAALAVMAGTLIPATATFADALNPLTHRSLTLSSSAPGWNYTDGSGNPTYAQPNSGANGQKTGNTFQFNVSSDSTAAVIKGFTFQYCTGSAGECTAPGDNASTGGTSTTSNPAGRETNADAIAAGHKTSDLDVVTSSPSQVTSAKFTADYDATKGQPTTDAKMPKRDNSEGNFIVIYKDTTAGVLASNWSYSTGWAMTASNVENGTGNLTGTNNNIKLANSAGGLSLHTGAAVKIVFYGTDTNYITNPGSGAFFVKINDYNSATTMDNTTLVDGGVTVANVMNQSIEIQTKVLETMDFSVGTVDPDTLTHAQLSTATSGGLTQHTPCDRILQAMTPVSSTNPANTLQMGDTTQENSLKTTVTYSTHSYWRLSSNSSAGATVYYSGVTLSNTVGDQIDAINGGTGNSTAPTVGAEQFGLALTNGTIANNDVVGPTGGTYANGGNGLYNVNYNTERAGGKVYENAADNSTTGIDASTTTDVGSNPSYHAPQLYPMIPQSNYDSGAGTVNNNYSSGSDPINTKFAFDVNSNLIPTPIATENNQVVDCVTGKMRYIANIAATTPAGIYTTKVNYIAAPQY